MQRTFYLRCKVTAPYNLLHYPHNYRRLLLIPLKTPKRCRWRTNIDITFGSAIKKGEGVITLIDSEGNTVESYGVGVSFKYYDCGLNSFNKSYSYIGV